MSTETTLGKPEQYSVGIDTIERCEANMTVHQCITCARFNIDKYNWRKKGQDLSDAKKISFYSKWLEELLKIAEDYPVEAINQTVREAKELIKEEDKEPKWTVAVFEIGLVIPKEKFISCMNTETDALEEALRFWKGEYPKEGYFIQVFKYDKKFYCR